MLLIGYIIITTYQVYAVGFDVNICKTQQNKFFKKKNFKAFWTDYVV